MGDKEEDVSSIVSSNNRSIMTPTEAKMKARDQLLRDVMTETAEENRGICTLDYRKAAFIDWVILLFILSQVGIVDLHDDDDDGGWSDSARVYNSDDDGRITESSLHSRDIRNPFDPPAAISRLERLIELNVMFMAADIFPWNFPHYQR